MTWYIYVVSKPDLKFDRNSTRLKIAGKLLPPGSYDVGKGAKAILYYGAVNRGGPGTVKVVLRDEKNNKQLYEREFTVEPGREIVSDEIILTVNNDMALKLYAYALINGKWVETDSYG